MEESLHPVFAKGMEMRRRLCRWILFLQTELEYEWPVERLAPGLRGLYQPNWFEHFLLRPARVARSNERLFKCGDYHLWPFLQESDFEAARRACAEKWAKQSIVTEI